ncbi:MAG TPA: glycoside hydrolase family 20 zincin-like fold domain-containing protein [Flavitalea sp.]|nr:glycoside hydrolase family 20 zincin-like fold domain-containing protein [Flavitalea sp.]
MRGLYLILFLTINLITIGGFSQAIGTSLLPVPRQTALNDERYVIDDTWSVSTSKNISKNEPALNSLTAQLKERFAIGLSTIISNKQLRLVVDPGSVNISVATDTNRAALKKQAYRLQLEKDRITITANAGQGLFYGVQTLIQIIQKENGKTLYPGGSITDWPDMDLRMIYWDDAHHLEHMDAMKRAIRQASYYKINAFTVKLEGHFQFSAAKPIVEPYAYTPAEYQELTDYAKAHYIELVPWLDAPAHISFILKHPEYKDLRAFANSNYQLSVINPKSDELILGMFDDLFNANKGGKYVLLSTDEAYYTGMSENETKQAAAAGSKGRLLAQYIARIANKLHEKGRTVIIWVEYPLEKSDITTLPSHIVSGVYNSEWAPAIKAHGMRQMIYTSTQGVEPFFPNYKKQLIKKADRTGSLALTDDEEQQGELLRGRVGEVLNEITSAVAEHKADLMGVIVAAWGDAGLNPETFWLGYAAGAAPGWNNKSMTSQDLSNRFYHSFYGPNTIHMDSIYGLLSSQADFWDKSWDWMASDWRTPIFGNSYKIFDTAKPAKDQTLPMFPVPSGTDLSLNINWNEINKERLALAERFMTDNSKLMELLQANLERIDYQQYNLHVLYSVARLCRQNLNMLLDLKSMNELLMLASRTASRDPMMSLSLIDIALDRVKRIANDRNEVLQSVSHVWYTDWFPRVNKANGRTFLNQVDDVKDHQPVRTVDLSYLILRQLKYPLGKWFDDVLASRNQFAKQHNLSSRTEHFDWQKYK